MKTITRILVVLVTLAFSTAASAQTAVINGTITDRETGEAIVGATIRLEGTQLGAVTGQKGRFTVKSVPSGTIRLRISMIGYEPATTTLIVQTGEQKDIVLTLLPSQLHSAEIVVSASKRIQAAQDVPISISVVNAKDLEDRGLTRLDDALRYVSGISVQRDQVSIRGASGFAFGVGSRVAVLLDGFPLLSGDNGDIKFDVLPVADVERIEIVKGAGSALYGTGALGGVVSLVTKEATTTPSFYVRTYGGFWTEPRFDDWKWSASTPVLGGADVRYAQRFGDVSVSISGGIRNDDGYRDYDGFNRGFGYTKVQWQASETSTFTLFGFGTSEARENFVYWNGLRQATFPQDDVNRQQRLHTSKIAGGLHWQEQITTSSVLSLRLGTFRTHFEDRIAGTKVDSNTSTAWSHNAEAQYTTDLTSISVLTTGFAVRVNDVGSDVYGNQIQSVFSAYAQSEITILPNLIATVGLRADREETYTLPSQFELSPKAGVTFEIDDNTVARASVGRGFRAATVAERYARIRYGAFAVAPNPSIRPESSWSGEIGIRHTTHHWILPVEIDVAFFDNELYDLIEPTFDVTSSTAPIVFTNLQRARILGIEAVLRSMLLPNLGVELGITAMSPRDLLLNDVLKYRNSILWYNRFSWQPLSWLDVQLDYRFTSRVERVNERLNLFVTEANLRVPSHIVDARLFIDLKPLLSTNLRLGLLGRNIFDYYSTDIPANLAPTRSFVVQVEWR